MYNSNHQAAKDFSMHTEGTNTFGWMDEGIRLVASATLNVEQFVRGYARQAISGWSSMHDVKASDATIYKVWRSGREFKQLCDYVRDVMNEDDSVETETQGDKMVVTVNMFLKIDSAGRVRWYTVGTAEQYYNNVLVVPEPDVSPALASAFLEAMGEGSLAFTSAQQAMEFSIND